MGEQPCSPRRRSSRHRYSSSDAATGGAASGFALCGLHHGLVLPQSVPGLCNKPTHTALTLFLPFKLRHPQ